MLDSPPPDQSVSADAFLAWEHRIRESGHGQVDQRTLRKFRQVVRCSAELWLQQPARRLRAVRADDACLLRFEFQYRDQWLSCFSLQVHHDVGLCMLKGPYPQRRRARLPEEAVRLFDRLWERWRNWPESEGLGQVTVTVYLHSWAAADLEKYAASASEAVAALQGQIGAEATRQAEAAAYPDAEMKTATGKENKSKAASASTGKAVRKPTPASTKKASSRPAGRTRKTGIKARKRRT